MSVSVEFHFDFGSPNSYYSHRVIPAIEERTGVMIMVQELFYSAGSLDTPS